ncbi:putative quinol monooxygenase [Cyclobacterium plantarum]|uniref:putative quinol monooxygenase n=1 Tax=Cyclobacterium plantarum TaxID=2716263 RepID=UPI003F724FAD
MNYYGLIGNLKAKKDKGAELLAVLLDAATILQEAKGCRQYIVAHEKAHPEMVWITEIWDSKELYSESLKLKGVKELIQKAMPLIAEPPKPGVETQPIGGVGKSIF